MSHYRKVLPIAVLLLAAVGLGYIKILPPVFGYFLGFAKTVRIGVSL